MFSHCFILTQKYGSDQVTGYSEYWKANNIYDLAGNCNEWTQDADNTKYRAYRGGFHGDDGLFIPASHRTYCEADYSNGSGKRFSSHFNNKVALGAFNFNCVKLKV